MDNRLTTAETLTQRTVWLIVTVLAVVLLVVFAVDRLRYADPYVKSVLSLEGDAAQGQVIFEMNCAVCHGIGGDGRVGPSLHHVASRKSRLGLIHQVTSGETPPMPQFQPTAQEMADLLRYLESL